MGPGAGTPDAGASRVSPRALLCLSSLALAACGGSTSSVSSSTDGGPGEAGVTAAQAAADAAMAYCTRAQACAPAYVTFGFGDVATCEARFALELLPFFTATGTSSSPSQTEACAQAIPQMSCADLLARRVAGPCASMPGQLANGAACAGDPQCAGTRCKVAADAVCGTCTAPAAAGAACGVDSDCQPGMTCVNLVCAKYGDESAACSATQPCRPDLGCVGGTCTTPSPAGTKCQASTECDQIHGVFCNPVTAMCEAVAFAATGAPCGLVNSQLTVCTGPGSMCSGSSAPPYRGTCLGFAHDGASCDTDAGPLCDVAAVCVGGTCKLPDPSTCH
jgi:hypothetical protein